MYHPSTLVYIDVPRCTTLVHWCTLMYHPCTLVYIDVPRCTTLVHWCTMMFHPRTTLVPCCATRVPCCIVLYRGYTKFYRACSVVGPPCCNSDCAHAETSLAHVRAHVPLCRVLLSVASDLGTLSWYWPDEPAERNRRIRHMWMVSVLQELRARDSRPRTVSPAGLRA